MTGEESPFVVESELVVSVVEPAYWFPAVCTVTWCPRFDVEVEVQVATHVSGLLQWPTNLVCPGCGLEPRNGQLHRGRVPVRHVGRVT